MRRYIVLALILCLGGIAEVFADFPNKPVRVVVPYPPGGGADILARTLAQKLTERWKQPVVVENRAGATGIIGVEAVKNSAADGYSVLFSASQEVAINPSLYKKLPYDPLTDLIAVTLVASTPNVFVVHPSFPAADFKTFVMEAKKRPGEINYASVGVGSSQHVAGEVLKIEAQINLTIIPYKGGGPQVTDLIGGQVHSGFVALPAAVQHVRQGKLRALGITAGGRSPALPNVPTMSEVGLPGVDIDQWYGVFVPAKTPAGMVEELSAAFISAINSPDVQARMIDLGYKPRGTTSGELAEFLRDQLSRYRKVVRDANIPLQ